MSACWSILQFAKRDRRSATERDPQWAKLWLPLRRRESVTQVQRGLKRYEITSEN